MATFLPLLSGGEISAMYKGLSIEAIPTPMPAANRIEINMARPSENAIPNEEAANTRAESINPGLRPYLFAMKPAIKQPIIHPKASEPVKKPSHQAFN